MRGRKEETFIYLGATLKRKSGRSHRGGGGGSAGAYGEGLRTLPVAKKKPRPPSELRGRQLHSLG